MDSTYIIHICVVYTYVYIYIYIYIHIYIYILYTYESQIVRHNPCFNLFILRNNSFDNQKSEINKNDNFLRFETLSFTKIFFL